MENALAGSRQCSQNEGRETLYKLYILLPGSPSLIFLPPASFSPLLHPVCTNVEAAG